MTTVSEIPLSPDPQRFSIALGGAAYLMRVTFADVADGGWVLDIATADGVAIVNGIPLVTGADLLAQYRHLGFIGSLIVQTDHDPDAVPTFENLGDTSHLFFVAQ